MAAKAQLATGETKKAFQTRLESLGWWEHFKCLREGKKKQLRLAGWPEGDGAQVAWNWASHAFPLSLKARAEYTGDLPLPPGDMPLPTVPVKMTKDLEDGAPLEQVLRNSPNIFKDFEWVYENLTKTIDVLQFPGAGAQGLWTWAQSNQAKFFESYIGLATKVLAKDEKNGSKDDKVVEGLATRILEAYPAGPAGEPGVAAVAAQQSP